MIKVGIKSGGGALAKGLYQPRQTSRKRIEENSTEHQRRPTQAQDKM